MSLSPRSIATCAPENWSRAPAVIRAMSESALTRTSPLMSGSLGFATPRSLATDFITWAKR